MAKKPTAKVEFVPMNQDVAASILKCVDAAMKYAGRAIMQDAVNVENYVRSQIPEEVKKDEQHS